MKGKLLKGEDGYYLFTDESYINPIASNHENWIKIHNGHKLSKENCDEIFGIFDIKKFADEKFTPSNKNVYGLDNWNNEMIFYSKLSFKEGFQKSMELNDKLFTVEDIKNAYMDGVSNGHNFGYPAIDQTDKYVQSLQQPKDIEVEIEQVLIQSSIEGEAIWKYRLDENGFLILKK